RVATPPCPTVLRCLSQHPNIPEHGSCSGINHCPGSACVIPNILNMGGVAAQCHSDEASLLHPSEQHPGGVVALAQGLGGLKGGQGPAGPGEHVDDALLLRW